MKQTLGLIVGNRGFFPAELARDGRKKMLSLLTGWGYDVVCLSPEDTRYGAVETADDARKCAELFDEHRKTISGVVVALPNFGDEKAIAHTLRQSGLNVPVLVQAFPDDPSTMTIESRRDSFCGKLSVCSNLRQFGIPFSLTGEHTVHPDSEIFAGDIAWFSAVCRVVNGFKNLKAGAIGARPNAFNTVRFSEKILESFGISVETADLSEIIGQANRLADSEAKVTGKLAEIKAYIPSEGVPEASLTKMAKLAVVLDEWIAASGVKLFAFQCWTSIQKNYGIMPCTVMSMFSEKLLPAACEVDLTGGLGMYALQLASGTPSALVDWNNNYGDDPDKAVLFHCSNYPRSLLENPRMGFGDILSSSAVSKDQAYGTCYGTIPAGPATLARLATDDTTGGITAYIAEGEILPERIDTFGGIGIVDIPELQDLLNHLCEGGFEHHVALNLSYSGDVLNEAFQKYLGFDTYFHGPLDMV
ncbi:MAG TPA: L-fucose/L-arabinose isomerase family protein [Atribacteraceae bacterium]|nr:L-fucose/L-arabinose isomerase family protein [Atribacteraceae bacterium]